MFFLLKTNPGCLSPPITSLQVDRSELAAAFKLFDETAIDPTFCDRMMSDLLPDDQGTLDFYEFSNFLVQFLQHQFLHKLEPFISNQSLFVTLGGRDLSAVIEEELLMELEGGREGHRRDHAAQEKDFILVMGPWDLRFRLHMLFVLGQVQNPVQAGSLLSQAGAMYHLDPPQGGARKVDKMVFYPSLHFL